MISRVFLFFMPLLIVLGLLTACKKVEGPGGSSSIIGKVYIIDKDAAGNIITEYDAQKFDVFLVYGTDGFSYDDDVETSYDGSFKFDYLEKGNYQLFVYEKCNSCPGGKKALFTNVEITDKKSTVDVGTITVID